MRHEIEPTLNTFRFHLLLLSFRLADDNDLTELPPGIFDSLTLLEDLYVLLAGCGDIFCFLPP